MVQVSDTAAIAFQAFLDTEDDANVIRLELAKMPGDESMMIRFAAVQAPSEGDVQAAARDVEIFVAPELAEPLSNAVIDTQTTPEGTELVIRRQDEAAAPGSRSASAPNAANGQNGQNRDGRGSNQA